MTSLKWSNYCENATGTSKMEAWKVIVRISNVSLHQNACSLMLFIIFYTFWPTINLMWVIQWFFTHFIILLIKFSYSPGNKQLDNVDALLTNGKNYQNPVILLRYEASHTTKWYSQDSCHWYGAEECSLWWITISWQLAYRIRRDVYHVLHFNLYKLNFNNTINSGIKRSIGRCGLFHISSSVSAPIFSIYESLGHHHYSW